MNTEKTVELNALLMLIGAMALVGEANSMSKEHQTFLALTLSEKDVLMATVEAMRQSIMLGDALLPQAVAVIKEVANVQ